MPMFKTRPEVKDRVDRVIKRYSAFVTEDLRQLDDEATVVRVADLRAVRPTVADLRAEAQSILDAAGPADLSADEKHDLQVLVEEADASLAQLDAELDPDKQWQKMDRSAKNQLIHSARVSNEKVRNITRTLRHQSRAQRLGQVPNSEELPPPSENAGPVLDKTDRRYFDENGKRK